MAIADTSDMKCTIMDSALERCYHSAKTAASRLRCTAPQETFCEIHTMIAKCFYCFFAPSNPETPLRFHLDSARQLLECTVTCGNVNSSFKIGGVLKYIKGAHLLYLQS